MARYLIRCENGAPIKGGRALLWTAKLNARADMLECNDKGVVIGKADNAKSGGFTRDQIISMLAKVDPKAAIRANMSDEDMFTDVDPGADPAVKAAIKAQEETQEKLNNDLSEEAIRSELGIPEDVSLGSKKSLVQWARKQGIEINMDDFTGKPAEDVQEAIRKALATV